MRNTGLSNPAIYTPLAVMAMNRAYDEACEILKREGASSRVQYKVGEHIMYLARNGETDAHRLCALAVQVGLGYAPDRLIVKIAA